MNDKQDVAADSTAARVALWRALHVEADPLPHVLEDKIGLKLLSPGEGWRSRGDMDPQFTRPFRASIVARARFIELMWPYPVVPVRQVMADVSVCFLRRHGTH